MLTPAETQLLQRLGHALQTPVLRVLLPVHTTVRLPGVRRWVRGQGDPVRWIQSTATRHGDLVLLDLRSCHLPPAQLRGLAAWAREVQGRGITLCVVGRPWHRASLSRLISHEELGNLDIVWCN